MTDLDEEIATAFVVLVNEQEQHSLWPNIKGVPRGWTSAYGPASKQECLEYVEQAWKDIAPLKIRAQVAVHH